MKRYNPKYRQILQEPRMVHEYIEGMEESQFGEWVKYEDVKKLEKMFVEEILKKFKLKI